MKNLQEWLQKDPNIDKDIRIRISAAYKIPHTGETHSIKVDAPYIEDKDDNTPSDNSNIPNL